MAACSTTPPHNTTENSLACDVVAGIRVPFDFVALNRIVCFEKRTNVKAREQAWSVNFSVSDTFGCQVLITARVLQQEFEIISLYLLLQ